MPPPIVPEPQFQPLHDVLAKAFASEPKICCAFLNDNGSHCQYTPKFTKIEDAMYWVTFVSQSLYSIRNQHSPLPGYMSQLCHYCLCSDHRFGGYANSKWEKDLKNEVMKEKFISLLKTNKKWPPPVRVLEFNPFKSDFPLLDTIKRVDKVLAKDINGIDKDYLYVLRSPWAVGKLKIGVSAEHPRTDRFKEHLKCYPDSKMLNQYGIPKRAYRVEQILLAQFQGNRFKLKDQCWVCGERHEEWLNIDEETLFDWIDEWVDFFIRGPVFPVYDKKGRFNAKALECSPLRDSPEGPTKITPIKKGALFLSGSTTPPNERPSPISKLVGDKEPSWEMPENPDSTPTKSNDRLSREPTPLNDSPDPFSEFGSDRNHKKVNSNSLGIPESTPTKNSRRSSLRSSTPLNDSPVPSKLTGDVEKTSKNSLKLPDSNPTKNHRRSLSPSPSTSPTPLDERPISSRKIRGDVKKSVDSALDTPLISGVDSLTINSSQRRTSARLKTPVK
ncbi:hypothetical protein N7520_000212 [Penicillium odoratum]|uniref:uncharacterized protein n=1 Tax=Penicillium odoratum TaxID=1167516 RepID=UPI002548EEC5|nr:uncharacterized protein N7520_000212 [Penicillium odoratum]KAJ5776966.1 hypothetical protein N7520_000212 [Penicillium odoratum]